MAEAALPQMVVVRDGSRAPGYRPRSAPAPVAENRERPALREFPHDLHAPGAPADRLRPLRSLSTARALAGTPDDPDTLRLAIFRVDFLQDSAGDAFTGDGRFDLGPPGDVPVDPPPHNKLYLEKHAEALKRYYLAQSYGSLVIEPTVFPAGSDDAYHLGDTGNYGPWTVSQDQVVLEMAISFVSDAIAAVDQSGEVDFSAFDAFVVVHAGADFQGDINRDTPYDIPSFTLTLGDSLVVNGGAAKVGRVLVLPATSSQDGRLAALNGVFAHEFGHVLGLPDLYNIFNGVSQVNYWSLMDSGENITAIVVDPETETEFEADGIFPTSLDPWCKMQLFPGVLDPARQTVGEVREEGLEAIQINPFFPIVPIDGFEYFLVENRAFDMDGNGFPFVLQDSTTGVFMGPVDDPDNPGTLGHLEYDAVLPGEGILIWHIDDKIVIPGLAGSGAINLYPWFRGVNLEEADGIVDMYSTPQDPFFVGNNDHFAPGTVPGSEANDGSYSGITVDITTVPGRVMGIRIERALARDGWPVFVRQDQQVFTDPGPMVPADLDGDGTREMVVWTDVRVTGQPRTRGLVGIRADGSIYTGGEDSTFVATHNNRIFPGLAASDDFVLRAGEPGSTVVALTETGGRPYLWNAAGQNQLTGGVIAPGLLTPARTPPVLWNRGADPGAVVFAGRGALYAVAVPGTLVFGDTLETAANAFPTAGPVLLADAAVAAVGYDSGHLAFFSLDGSRQVTEPVLLSTPARFLVAGNLGADGSPRVAAFTRDSVLVIPAFGTGATMAWAVPGGDSLSVPPAVGDVDGDGRSEIVAATVTGTVFAWNGDGSPALGWPRSVPDAVVGLALADLDGNGGLDVLALDDRGRFHGWEGQGHPLDTFPRPEGPITIVSSGLIELDPGELTWVASSSQGVFEAVRFPGSARIAGDWLLEGGTPEGTRHQPAPAGSGGFVAGRPDLDGNPVLVYPNPARGDGVEIRFLLEAGETAEVEVVDLRGTVVSDGRLDLRGGFREGENAVRWNVTDVAPGLYFCRVERDGPGGRQVDLSKIVVAR